MLNKSKIVGSLAGLGFLLALTPNTALAQEAVRPCGGNLRHLRAQGNVYRWRCFIAQATRTKMEVEMPVSADEQTSRFQKIEQPFSLKIVVVLAGFGLIGAELWWFMLSKTKSQKAQVKQGIQEVNIVVDGGYTPDRIEVTVGEPVRLNFYRQDPRGCLEQLLLPDFNKALDLTLNQTTSVEIVPEKPGEYSFTCGMNMYQGIIRAEASKS